MNRGAWWATVHGIAKSQTQLKQLSRHTRSKKCMNMIRLDVTTPSSEVYPMMKEKKKEGGRKGMRGERQRVPGKREKESSGYRKKTQNKTWRDFPSGPVVMSPCSQCRGPGFNP